MTVLGDRDSILSEARTDVRPLEQIDPEIALEHSLDFGSTT